MKEHYVSYSQADKLKELGFDWPCTAHFSSDGSQLWTKHQEVINSEEFESPAAPRLDQAAAWLREQYGIHTVITPIRQCFYENRRFVREKHYWNFDLMQIKDGWKPYGSLVEYDSYELALSAGIDAAIELLTNKQTDK